MTEEEPVIVEVTVDAPAAALYEMFTQADQLALWIGISAELEPHPGGLFRFEIFPGEYCSGRYVELDPPRRVVFTWGWESGALPVAPGSSTVEVDLEETGGSTRVRVVHKGFGGEMNEFHEHGWQTFLARLAAVAEGRDPGHDPAAPYAAGQPLPSIDELRRK